VPVPVHATEARRERRAVDRGDRRGDHAEDRKRDLDLLPEFVQKREPMIRVRPHRFTVDADRDVVVAGRRERDADEHEADESGEDERVDLQRSA
jgi:hypothetical protein